jgi:hypothetical protein
VLRQTEPEISTAQLPGDVHSGQSEFGLVLKLDEEMVLHSFTGPTEADQQRA